MLGKHLSAPAINDHFWAKTRVGLSLAARLASVQSASGSDEKSAIPKTNPECLLESVRFSASAQESRQHVENKRLD